MLLAAHDAGKLAYFAHAAYSPTPAASPHAQAILDTRGIFRAPSRCS